jgi:hypothetical protein
MWTFRSSFSEDAQISAEKAIAYQIFEAGLQDEDACAQLGRDILLSVLAEFRPDLLEALDATPDVEFLGETPDGGRKYDCEGVAFLLSVVLGENRAKLSYFNPVPGFPSGGVWVPVTGDWFDARSMDEAEQEAYALMRKYAEKIKNELGI